MSHLKIIVPAFILSGFLITTNIAQADYQNEIGLFTYQSEDEDNDTADGITLFYTYFFNNVDTSKGPWGEAAFINRAGNLGVSLSNSETQYGDTTFNKSKITTIDRSEQAIFAEIANPDSNLVFTADYSSSESDYAHETSPYSSETTAYTLGIGYFIQKYTLISFTHNETEIEINRQPTPYSYDTKSNSIDIKTLILRDGSTALALNAGYAINEYPGDVEIKTTQLSANYYFNPRLGVGGNLTKYSTNESQLSDGSSYSINMTYFINPQIQIGLLYSQFKADNDTGTDSDMAQATASYYF